MMAAKARLFGDAEAERQALLAPNPAVAKRAGRLVRGFDEAVWKKERFGIVVAAASTSSGSTRTCATTC